jgi:hypothetical protein
MQPVSIGFALVGAFYVFAGFVAARAALSSWMLDQALAAISAKPVPARERHLTLWMLASAWLVLTGGVAALLLLPVAPWLFGVCALSQAFYLVFLAPHYFDVEDPPDPLGRQRTVNAFVLYAVVTAGLVAARGELTAWEQATLFQWALFGAVSTAFGFYLMWRAATFVHTRPPHDPGEAP